MNEAELERHEVVALLVRNGDKVIRTYRKLKEEWVELVDFKNLID
ncbi:hypothetical protein JOC34_000613 [Virgibacillus halotolerans]|nr:hypothetical protein [Virgibacillus halotolerans]